MESRENLEKQSTFDLAFGLAMSKYDETEKLIVLDIIKKRNGTSVSSGSPDQPLLAEPVFKAGSKSEKIYNHFKSGKTPKQIYDIMNKHKQTVYYPEIYRVTSKIPK